MAFSAWGLGLGVQSVGFGNEALFRGWAFLSSVV